MLLRVTSLAGGASSSPVTNPAEPALPRFNLAPGRGAVR
ncbi:hypothetical protein BDIM_24760 [Brevundimonas diminuta ATCC 11568]|nr:hypothetical protein BDIM_24760 [Brevundimonas diminuta ATCC 11568]